MNLYKANFTAIIHCNDIDDATDIARDLAVNESSFAYEEDSIVQIFSEDDLPYGQEPEFYPIEANLDSGSLKIKKILALNNKEYARQKRIIELEKELNDLKNQQYFEAKNL